MIRTRQTVLLLGDMLALVLSFVVMALIRFDFGSQGVYITLQAKLFAGLFILWLIIFFIFDLYNLKRVNPNPRTIGLLAIAIIVNTVLSGILFYLFPTFFGIAPKINLVLVAASAFIILTLWRRIFYKLFVSRFTQRIAVLGSGPVVNHFLEELAAHPHIGHAASVEAEQVLNTDGLSIDLLIVEGMGLETVLAITEKAHCEVLSLFDAYEELFAKIPLSLMSEERAMMILKKPALHGYSVVERIIEIVVASLVLIITSPFLLIAMLAICIEDGRPVIYRQVRVGKHGKLFSLFKLRTMSKNAEADGAQWAQKNDPRSTRIGALLRTLHIDELPQMVNVLRGDIALIGPRPERPEFVATLSTEIPYYNLRHAVKPGFTGWAQIKFRYARTVLDSQEKFEYDLYYLRNKSPLLDLGILLKTIQIIFTH